VAKGHGRIAGESAYLFNERVRVLPGVGSAVGRHSLVVKLKVELELLDPESAVLESLDAELLREGLEELDVRLNVLDLVSLVDLDVSERASLNDVLGVSVGELSTGPTKKWENAWVRDEQKDDI
jgi:hypothetical protein